MELTERQKQLLDYVTTKHGSQKRKYTEEPYVNHCLNVAKIVSEHEENCIEIALCHDLFEDTDCNLSSLCGMLLKLGYSINNAFDICTGVNELTDRFTHEKYPQYNREKRKELEAERLKTISYLAQTVKYADLIDNTSSIVAHDKGFAKVYLKEKERVLSGMKGGNQTLYRICLQTLETAKEEQWKTN